MASYNKVLLMGNLTRDIETRQAGSTTVASFGLAVNERFKGSDGNPQERVSFLDCEAWGKTGEIMAQYLSKGRPVFVEGRLQQDTWQDKDTGANRSKIKVVVQSFQFIDSGSDESRKGASNQRSGSRQSKGKDAHSSGFENYGDPISADDIPF